VSIRKPEPLPRKFLRTSQILARYDGVSFMWLERKLRSDPTFPRPFKFGGRYRFFDLDELEAWERQQAKNRDAYKPRRKSGAEAHA
jgi:predicted DNA-binding transcriptional regulator AlpA